MKLLAHKKLIPCCLGNLMSEPVMISDLFPTDVKIGLISKDAGASNLMVYSLKGRPNTLVYCEEPGKSIYLSRGFTMASCAEEVFRFSDKLIIGTGGSDFEKIHLQLALETGCDTYSVLDHWINFEARFEFGEVLLQPLKLLVFDEDARDLAQNKFPNTPIFWLVNKYQECIQNQVQSLSKSNSKITFLYIHENLKHDFAGNEYWRVCFESFYRRVCSLHSDFVIKLRFHPKDNPNDFKKFLSEYPGVVLSNSNLAIDIAQSDIVVGVRSAALEVARKCGKSVFTTNISPKIKLPGPISRLPIFQHKYVL